MSNLVITLKIIVLGEPGVGKTSIIGRFVNGTFDQTYKATVGFSHHSRTVDADGEKYALDVWDTCGSERFRSVAPTYYRGSDACILVYDATQLKTVEALSYWYEEFSSIVNTDIGSNVPVLIVGNKSDEPRDDTTVKKALFLKDALGFSEHYLVSARSGQNIEAPFLRLVELCANRHNSENSPTLMLRTGGASVQKTTGCC
jgi:small GTP-binding protein